MGGSFARLKLPAAATATRDAANQVYTWNGALQSYDKAGNLLNDPVSGGPLTWDVTGRLSQMASPGNNPVVYLSYDAFGRRVEKDWENISGGCGFICESGATTSFLYDGLNPVQEQSYTSTNFLPSPTTNTDLLTGLGLDELFTRSDSSGTIAVLADGLGSTLALVDSAGNMPTTYSYSPFGDTTVNGTASSNAFQFTGRANEATSLSMSSLYYFRNRYYSPLQQRFISADPLRFGGGDVNLYAYVANDPLSFIDPDGLVRVKKFLYTPTPTLPPTPTPPPPAGPTPMPTFESPIEGLSDLEYSVYRNSGFSDSEIRLLIATIGLDEVKRRVRLITPTPGAPETPRPQKTPNPRMFQGGLSPGCGLESLGTRPCLNLGSGIPAGGVGFPGSFTIGINPTGGGGGEGGGGGGTGGGL